MVKAGAKLVAIDPVSQTTRWTVEQPLPFNGGILATGGNLVFQGNAEGYFVAYAADTGEQLWSVQTGSAFGAGASTYSIDGKQMGTLGESGEILVGRSLDLASLSSNRG